MVGEYSPVASAAVEHPRYLATGRDSVVADATVKTFHPHRGLKPCHYPNYCAKYALSSSRSDGLNLAVRFNALSLPKLLHETDVEFEI
jgi:hypothetical protein